MCDLLHILAALWQEQCKWLLLEAFIIARTTDSQDLVCLLLLQTNIKSWSHQKTTQKNL
jgi:hypothetical protein